MATKYWVGGNGNWSSLTNWRTTSGGAVVTTAPGSADAAVLDANSGASVVTVDSNITIQTLTCTGFTGTLAFGTNTITLNSNGTIFTGATTMTVTGTPLIISTYSSTLSRTIAPTPVTEANSISFRIAAGATASTFAVTTGHAVKDLDFTDGTNPTGYGGTFNSNNFTIYGNFKASTGMTQTAGTGTMTFAATSGTKTINTAGVTFDRPFTFDGVGGTFQLASALTSGTSRTCTLTNGTLDLNGYTLTTGAFSSTNSNTRTLAFGSTGKIVATVNNGTACVTSTATGLTVTGSKRVELNYSGSVGTRIISGALTATTIEGVNLLDYYITAGADTILVTASRSYGNIDFSNGGTSTFAGSLSAPTNTTAIYGNLILNSAMSLGSGTDSIQMKSTSGTKTITSAGKTLGFPITFDGVGGTWTCTDALNIDGNTLTMINGTLKLKAGATSTVGMFATSGTNQKYLQSSTAGTQATISDASGIITVNYLTIQDSNATGGASWDANASTNVNAGNNTGWFFAPTPSVANEIEIRLRSFTQPRRF
jgi:hypothetical protein